MRTLLLCVLIMSVLAGCNTKQENSASPSPSNEQVEVQQTNPPVQNIENPEDVSERLEALALSIPEVKAAHCVVFGDTAIVGIDVSGDLDRSRVGTLKYSVAEALRKDPYGVNAVVTADMDLGSRIRDIRRHIAKGHPVSGFAEEMADIMGRIMPQLPRHTEKNEDPMQESDGREQLQNRNM